MSFDTMNYDVVLTVAVCFALLPILLCIVLFFKPKKVEPTSEVEKLKLRIPMIGQDRVDLDDLRGYSADDPAMGHPHGSYWYDAKKDEVFWNTGEYGACCKPGDVAGGVLVYLGDVQDFE